MNQSPQSTDELLERCSQIAGLTLGQLAEHYQLQLPANLQREKGSVGQLLELVLGASSGSKAEPDFPQSARAQGKSCPEQHIWVWRT